MSLKLYDSVVCTEVGLNIHTFIYGKYVIVSVCKLICVCERQCVSLSVYSYALKVLHAVYFACLTADS